MSGGTVPVDDLPADLVPASDMPGAQAPAPAAKRRVMWGDAGAALSAGEAFEGVNKAISHGAYKLGGVVTDQVAKVAPAPVAAGAGVLANLATEAVPAILGGEAAKLASPKMISKAKDIMQSALKPSRAAQKSGEAGEAVDTLLERGANVTEGGVEKLTKYIDDLDDQLSRVIAQSKAEVSKMEVLAPIKEALSRFRNETSSTENLQKIREAAREFFHHPSLRGKDALPLQKAQEMKRANYRALGDKAYGTGLKPEAEREGIKAVTRGLKEGVERAAPEAGAINAEMGPLVNARDLAQERVLMSGNKNPIGLGILHPSSIPAWVADRSELAKSLLARGMYQGNRVIPQTAGNVVGGAAGAALGLPTPAPYVPQPPPQGNFR